MDLSSKHLHSERPLVESFEWSKRQIGKWGLCSLVSRLRRSEQPVCVRADIYVETFWIWTNAWQCDITKCRLRWRTICTHLMASLEIYYLRFDFHDVSDNKMENFRLVVDTTSFARRNIMAAHNHRRRATETISHSKNTIFIAAEHLLTVWTISILHHIGVIVRFYFRHVARRQSWTHREIPVRGIRRRTSFSYGNQSGPSASGGTTEGWAIHTNRQKEHHHQRQFQGSLFRWQILSVGKHHMVYQWRKGNFQSESISNRVEHIFQYKGIMRNDSN